MEVRTANKEDIPQILQLYRHLNLDDADIEIEDAYKRWELLQLYTGSQIYVGSLSDLIIATCTLIVIPNLTRGGAPYALIENVVTNAAYRKQGYGKMVLKKAIAAAWQAKCYKVMLLTGSKNPATLKFYQNAGFEQSKTGFQIRRTIPMPT